MTYQDLLKELNKLSPEELSLPIKVRDVCEDEIYFAMFDTGTIPAFNFYKYDDED